MRIAIVHDDLTQYGGAERVVEALAELWPEAPIYALFYDEAKTKEKFRGKRIVESFWARVPFLGKVIRRAHNRLFFWLMPFAVSRFDLSGFDVVISSSATYAKGARAASGALHVNYCHTPTRYLWDDIRKYSAGFYANPFVRFIGGFFLSAVRRWDKKAGLNPDFMIANSNHIASRIREVYGREADAVIFPPVNVGVFRSAMQGSVLPKDREYFLMVGRMLIYKRFDLGIEAARRRGFRLKIVGDGPEKDAFMRNVPSGVEFLGWVSDEDLPRIYAGAKALIFPQVEDFGIVAAEAIAAGTPVIADRAGGALDIIKEGENGVLFDRQTPEALCEAIERFGVMRFDPAAISASAEKFSKERFKEELMAFLKAKTPKF
jgi:glycosyltransferase involved in cell wall biosynthesis